MFQLEDIHVIKHLHCWSVHLTLTFDFLAERGVGENSNPPEWSIKSMTLLSLNISYDVQCRSQHFLIIKNPGCWLFSRNGGKLVTAMPQYEYREIMDGIQLLKNSSRQHKRSIVIFCFLPVCPETAATCLVFSPRKQWNTLITNNCSQQLRCSCWESDTLFGGTSSVDVEKT